MWRTVLFTFTPKKILHGFLSRKEQKQQALSKSSEQRAKIDEQGTTSKKFHLQNYKSKRLIF